jgi:hypothetical protein
LQSSISQGKQTINQEAGAAAVLDKMPYVSTMCPNQSSLCILGEEYGHDGIGGHQAACLFTSRERGKVKHKYHQRKVVGDYVYVLVHAGFIAQAANNHIYSTV